METNKCGICAEPLFDGAHCTVCDLELHFHCAGITETGYRKLGDRKLTWRCGRCKQSGSSQPPSSPRIESDGQVIREIKALSAKLIPLENLKDEVIALRIELAGLRTSIDDTNTQLKEFNSKIGEIEQRLEKVEKAQTQVEEIQSQVELMNTRMEKIENESHSSEQWARMNNIEIKGIPQVHNENLFDILFKIASNIQFSVAKTQINFITRVPTREKERTKPIIVCFCNRYIKEDFVAAARSASKSSPITTGLIGLAGNHRIFVNDHLTIQNKSLLAKTKKSAAEKNFQYVWVKHAKIYTRKNDTSHVISIKTARDLIKIV